MYTHLTSIQIRPVSSVSAKAAGILAGKDGVDWASSSALPDMIRQFFNDHKNEIAQCKSGNGVDRHLQGLKWRSELRNGGKADECFSSPGWAALQANEVSTSQMTAEGIQVQHPHSRAIRLVTLSAVTLTQVQLAGFGPVNTKGFGIGYSIEDSSSRCVVTSFR